MPRVCDQKDMSGQQEQADIGEERDADADRVQRDADDDRPRNRQPERLVAVRSLTQRSSQFC